MPDHLRGQIAAAMNSPEQAEQYFGWALKKNGKYLPALLGLVQLDLAAAKPDRARGRFVEFLQTNPRHVTGMLAYANFLLQRGARQEAAEKLSAALQLDPTDPAVRVAVIDQYLRAGDVRSALQSAQAAAAALPDSVAVLERVVAAQMAAGEANQAVATMSQVLSKRADLSSHLLMARALEAAGRLDDAQTQLSDARRLNADNPVVLQAAAWLAIKRGRHSEALELAKLMQKLKPTRLLATAWKPRLHLQEVRRQLRYPL
jgi:tetratricopeptide (TPR) repeat protein